MSEPPLSEIAKVPAGSAFNDRCAALEEESRRPPDATVPTPERPPPLGNLALAAPEN